MAKLAMRTQAVPAAASANGSASSDSAMSTTPAHFAKGYRFQGTDALPDFTLTPSCRRATTGSRAVTHALAEQPGRAQNQHRDQYQEGKHVLVIRAEQHEMRFGGAMLGERLRQAGEVAQVGELADIAGAQRFDHPEQDPAHHRTRDVADATEHRRRKRLQP